MVAKSICQKLKIEKLIYNQGFENNYPKKKMYNPKNLELLV